MLNVIMPSLVILNVIMLNVVKLNVIMPSAAMLSVIMLNVVAPNLRNDHLLEEDEEEAETRRERSVGETQGIEILGKKVISIFASVI